MQPDSSSPYSFDPSEDYEISVAILEDNRSELKGYQHLLENSVSRIWVVGVEAVPDLFIQTISTYIPDIAVIDLSLQGDINIGIKVIERVKQLSPDTKILVFTGKPTLMNFRNALIAGADGFLGKDGQSILLDEAVIRLYRGEALYPAEYMQQMARFITDQQIQQADNTIATQIATEAMPIPTSRELDVLCLWLKNQTEKEIAANLVIEIQTVRQHLKNLRKKWRVKRSDDLKLIAQVHFRSLMDKHCGTSDITKS